MTAAHDVPRGDAVIDGNGGGLNEEPFGTSDRAQLMEIKAMLTQIKAASKPILSVAEAADFLSVSPRRFANIIASEKRRLGRVPDFICDAGGVLSMRVLRDPLLDWAKRTRRKSNRSGGRGKRRASA